MNNERKSNIILLIILIIVIILGVFAYIRYQKGIEKTKLEDEKKAISQMELTCYTYGGVDKTSYMNYEDATNKIIEFYNNSDGTSLASMKDFAAEAVYDHKGINDFDSNLYTLVTDAYNYKDDYYNDSLVVMCTSLLDDENNFIDFTNKSKVKMKLEKLSELKKVDGSEYLYETIANININDKANKVKVDSKTRIVFISYDKGKSFYLLKTERME